MVAEEVQELQGDGFDADLDDEEITDELDLEPTDEDETPDPLAELRSQLEASRNELAALQAQVRGELGRGQRAERLLEEFKQSLASRPAPTDALATSLADDFGTLIEAFAASDIIDDRSRTSLMALKGRYDNARTERQQAALEQQILDRVAAATQNNRPAQDVALQLNPVIADLNARLSGYASARGVDFASLPSGTFQWQANDTIEAAEARVRGVIDAMADAEQSATRVASRRRAASTSPGRAGAALNDEELVDDYGMHPEKYNDPEAKKRVFAALARLESS